MTRDPSANSEKTVLVTGGSGFLGGYSINQSLEQDYRFRTSIGNLAKEPDIRASRHLSLRPALIALLLALGMLVSLALSGPAFANEKGASERLEKLRHSPTKLNNFLRQMPKGTDLHTHLTGAIYAESMVKWAAGDGKCVNTTTFAASFPPCVAGQVPVASALSNGTLYGQIIGAWSMRNFTPGPLQSEHDHFFATFDLFGSAVSGHLGEGLAEVAQRAGSQNEQYIEPLSTPAFGATNTVANSVTYTKDFAALRQSLIDAGLFNAIPAASSAAATTLASERATLGCDGAAPKKGCDVLIGFDVQVLRNTQPVVAFAQLLFGFELMKKDPNWVGMNMVQPEEGPLSLQYYNLQMQMIKYLKTLYPNEKLTLHAGELVPGIAPPEDLRFHIRQAVNIAGADRIGHGADLRWENNPTRILQSMKTTGTCIEINLASNRQTLGLAGKLHPFPDYVKAGVKTTLSTDDEGVERTDLTSQYSQAVRNYGYGYRQLKKFAKTGLQCSFLAPATKKAAIADQKQRFKAFEAKFPPK